MNRTAQIMADVRQTNVEAIAAFNETIDDTVEANGKRMRRNGVIRAGGSRYALATGRGRSEAGLTAAILLKGAGEFDRNAVKREHSLPRRALSMASSKGRCTPDMLDSLMAFFASPGAMAEHLLASFLPARPNYASLVTYLDGLGIQATKQDVADLLKGLGAGRTRGKGGRPRKVRTVDAFGHGHTRTYRSEAVPTGRIPGGNDVAHGIGHDAGAGWDTAWSEGKSMSPAQVSRRNAALDAYHAAAAAQVAEEA